MSAEAETRRYSGVGPETSVTPIGDDLNEVTVDGLIHGFVERSGDSYVALMGRTISCAVMLGESPSWDEALAMVAYSTRAPRTAVSAVSAVA